MAIILGSTLSRLRNVEPKFNMGVSSCLHLLSVSGKEFPHALLKCGQSPPPITMAVLLCIERYGGENKREPTYYNIYEFEYLFYPLVQTQNIKENTLPQT